MFNLTTLWNIQSNYIEHYREFSGLDLMEYIAAFRKASNLSESNEQELAVEKEIEEAEVEENTGLTKALDTYRKLKEVNKELTEKDQADLENKLTEIEKREIIEIDRPHEPTEILTEKGKITIGPPTLTRFERARIMGARALQLSLGAPTFISIPETARTSLDIALEELDQRVIPIVIRRVLPNGDYQNIPIGYFKK